MSVKLQTSWQLLWVNWLEPPVLYALSYHCTALPRTQALALVYLMKFGMAVLLGVFCEVVLIICIWGLIVVEVVEHVLQACQRQPWYVWFQQLLFNAIRNLLGVNWKFPSGKNHLAVEAMQVILSVWWSWSKHCVYWGCRELVVTRNWTSRRLGIARDLQLSGTVLIAQPKHLGFDFLVTAGFAGTSPVFTLSMYCDQCPQ